MASVWRQIVALEVAGFCEHHLYMRFWKKSADKSALQPVGCSICGRPLGIKLDPLSDDCGGDCWGCIGDIEARMDAEQNISIGLVAKEIAWGWRNADGTPKPQEFFLAGGPSFIKVLWHHSFPHEPVELWIELNGRRDEQRKLEIWSDDKIGYAFADTEVGGTRLSEKPIPPLTEIALGPEFEPQEVSRFAFEKIWDVNVRKRR